MTDKFLYLPDATLEAMHISPNDVALAIEDALRAKAQGALHTAPKTPILPGRDRYMMSTMAVGDDGFTVVKQVSVCPENPARGLAAINGAIMVLDAETGLLRAVVGANWVTAVRTAALSAVAAKRLADPASETIAFVGTGVQAHSHLDAFSALFPLKRMSMLGRGQANIDRLAQKAQAMGLETIACTTPEEALQDADIVVTSVTLDYSIAPFLNANLLKSNAFAAITDLCIPWLPDGMNAFKTVYVDDRAQEADSAKPMLPYDRIAGDLTDLVIKGPEIAAQDRPSAFAFRGIALGDYAAAVLALRRAEASGAGIQVGP
ncbi:MAG: ornithine cyclodeaminase family protein [Roseobacter sp.]